MNVTGTEKNMNMILIFMFLKYRTSGYTHDEMFPAPIYIQFLTPPEIRAYIDPGRRARGGRGQEFNE